MNHPGPVARAAELASLGHRASVSAEERARAWAGLHDDDVRVRVAALGALVRTHDPDVADAWNVLARDDDPAARRRAAELAPALRRRPGVVATLVAALDDPDVTVVEAAAWALGELGAAGGVDAVDGLARTATTHGDALAREAAVAALGAIGEPRGLPAILHATSDRPAVRRRAVLALAPFDGPEVDAALARAREDKDWQVRQAADDLL